jgi:hypothetical protein
MDWNNCKEYGRKRLLLGQGSMLICLKGHRTTTKTPEIIAGVLPEKRGRYVLNKTRERSHFTKWPDLSFCEDEGSTSQYRPKTTKTTIFRYFCSILFNKNYLFISRYIHKQLNTFLICDIPLCVIVMNNCDQFHSQHNYFTRQQSV